MTKIELPTLLELLENRLKYAGPRDKTINIEIAINTAKMILEKEKMMEKKYRELFEGAQGLSLGRDWNNGTHAVNHGYRRMLVKAVKKLESHD